MFWAVFPGVFYLFYMVLWLLTILLHALRKMLSSPKEI